MKAEMVKTGYGLVTPEQADELKPLLGRIAKASSLSESAWLELEQALPHCRAILPEFYQALTELMLGAFQAHQTIEGAGDDLVEQYLELNTPIGFTAVPQLDLPGGGHLPILGTVE